MNTDPAISAATESDLGLPPVAPYEPCGASTQYGVNRLVAGYCGQRPFRECPLPGIWQHGAVPPHWQRDPRMVTQSRHVRRNTRVWVAREDDVRYLADNGYPNARAIGLPVAYLPEAKFERRPGSLLVMPMHSRDSMTRELNFADYTGTLRSMVGDFESVVGCVHPACLKHGYWLDVFRELDIPIVLGAGAGDANALYRMQALMSQFEFMTSNGYGSHHAYAAHFGAKPSIVGSVVEPQRRDYERSFFYIRQPELLEIVLEVNSERGLRENLPFLFHDHPSGAGDARAWGSDLVGVANRLPPAALAGELRTSPAQRWLRTARELPRLLKNRAFGQFRAWQRRRLAAGAG